MLRETKAKMSRRAVTRVKNFDKSPSAGDCETSLDFLFLFLLALLFGTPAGSSPLSLGGFRTWLTATGCAVFSL